MIQPHTASPVAISAGLCFPTVSVKLAIHGAYAMARKAARTLMTTTSVEYDVLVPRLAKMIVITMAPIPPTTMNGLRTRTLSEMIPMMISTPASNAQNQLPMLLAFDSENPYRVVK